MDESYEPYEFLYDTRLGTKLKSLTLIATRFSDDDFEEYFNYLMTCTLEDLSDIEDEIEDDIENEINEINGTNEIVKIFNQKCVICLENNSVYAFRNCGHMCLCENCFDSNLTKCVVCRT